MHISICGGGNAAHTLSGLLASGGEHQVNVYASFGDEATRWLEGMSTGGMTVTMPGSAVVGRPRRVSADPSEVIPGSKLILLALPSFAHQVVLTQIAPFIEAGTWVGALPARGFFDLCAQDVLAEKADVVTLFGLQTLPWACRIVEYGREVNVMGVKDSVDLASCPANEVGEIAIVLKNLLGIGLNPMTGFLVLTLAGTGQLIHPGVMYGLFRDWDSGLLPKAPLFYQGVDDYTAGILEGLSSEVLNLRDELKKQFPDLDISPVRPLWEWLLQSYQNDISDPSSLKSSFNTNSGYAGLQAPVKQRDGGLVPDFQSRYLTEDVPYALIATRGVAELVEVPTPVMDQVITWAQAHIGKEYLVDGKLIGKDVQESRAPQRYGFNIIDPLVSPCITNPGA